MADQPQSNPEAAAGKEPSVWSNRVYCMLFSAQVATLTGSGISAIALGMLAANLVGSTVSEVVGIVLTIRIVARVFLSPWASTVSSWLGTKPAMLICDAISATAVLGYYFTTEVWQIYAFTVLLYLGEAIFTPLFKASVPRVVSAKQYPKALSYSAMAYQIANIGGPSLSGLLVVWVGISGNFLVDFFTYVASILIVWLIPRKYFLSRAEHAAERAAQKAKGKKTGALSGMRDVFGRNMLRQAFLLEWHAGISGALILVGTIDYVRFSLGGSDETYAWVMATYGIGSLLGAFWYSRAGDKTHAVMVTAVPMLMTLGLFSVTLAPSYLLLIVSWMICGAGGVVVNIRANQWLAEHSQPHEREGVFAAQFSLSHLMWLLTYPLAGFSTTWFGFYGACYLFAAINLALIIARKILDRPADTPPAADGTAN